MQQLDFYLLLHNKTACQNLTLLPIRGLPYYFYGQSVGQSLTKMQTLKVSHFETA